MARQGAAGPRTKLSTDVKVARGEAPAAGFEAARVNGHSEDLMRFQDSIGGPERQAQLLAELVESLERAEHQDAVCAELRKRLPDVISYQVMALYLKHGEVLVPAAVAGEDGGLFASLEIPVGTGLSGWVVENGKSILNGNPSVEPGYMNDPTKFSLLNAALAVPVENQRGIVGVLSLYRKERDSFSTAEMTVLLSAGLALGKALHAMPDRPVVVSNAVGATLA
jgi:putative methionine-R-sulfoxide reductase with GAF domain